MMIAIQCSEMFDGERFSEGGVTVLVEQNRIVGVESGFPRLGEQWRVRRYHNATLLPGLIDTHTHLVGDSRPGALDRVPGLSDDELNQVISESLQCQLVAGVTTVRDLGDRRYAVVDRRDRQHSVSTTAHEPTILGSDPPITSRAGHCYYLGGDVDGPAAISAAIRERLARKVDVVKVMASGGMSTPGTDVMRPQFTTADLRSIVEHVHAAGMVVTAHVHGLPAVEQAVTAAVDGLEHCTCLTDTGFELPDALLADIAAQRIAVSGVIPPPPDFDLADAAPAIRDMAAKTGISAQRFRELRADLVRRLHQAGVVVVTGIDSGLNPWLAHGNLHIAFELLAESGFTRAEVLAAAASQAAQVCAVGDRKGRIRHGYDADLIVVDGDLRRQAEGPLTVRATVLRGELLSEG
jgi:imidazolonepropionase-like amidohydrolase